MQNWVYDSDFETSSTVCHNRSAFKVVRHLTKYGAACLNNSMNNTDQMLHDALFATADASDSMVPDSGEGIRRFAEEKYPRIAMLFRLKCLCGCETTGNTNDKRFENGFVTCPGCGVSSQAETMKLAV